MAVAVQGVQVRGTPWNGRGTSTQRSRAVSEVAHREAGFLSPRAGPARCRCAGRGRPRVGATRRCAARGRNCLGGVPSAHAPSALWHARSWLHQEATVQAVDVIPEAGVADVTVVISKSAYGKFRKLFPA